MSTLRGNLIRDSGYSSLVVKLLPANLEAVALNPVRSLAFSLSVFSVVTKKQFSPGVATLMNLYEEFF